MQICYCSARLNFCSALVYTVTIICRKVDDGLWIWVKKIKEADFAWGK